MATLSLNDSANLWGYIVLLGAGFGICLTLTIALMQFCAPPHLVSISTGVMISARGLGATGLLPCYSAIFNSKLNKNLPAKIAEEVIPLGLSPKVLPAFIPALANNDLEALGKIQGVTPQIIQAGAYGLRVAYKDSLRPIWYLGLALSCVAVIRECPIRAVLSG